MLKIGVSQETGIGVTQSPSGHQMIWKRLFALVQLKNSKNYQDAVKLPIFTEKVLTILQFLPSKVKVF
jgi:hypothetical protein